MRRVIQPQNPAKLVCFVGTSSPLLEALQAFINGLSDVTVGDSGNTWTGTLTEESSSVEVVAVHVETEEAATAVDSRWMVKTQDMSADDLEKWPMTRKESTLIIHTNGGHAAPANIANADKLLKMLVSGTHPLGRRPEPGDPCLDRYRKWWIPAHS